jgi:membrane protein DedA with SNARE-associated domain
MDQWITDLLARTGYAGVVLLMVAENLFPPIPSELVMPFAGFTAARGALNLPLTIAAGTLGSVVGALPWYAAGRWTGAERLKRWAGRHGRWLTLAPDDVDAAQRWFGRHCGKSVLLGRLVPAVRTLISVPAGIARMSLPRFLAFSTVGSLVWTGALAALGYALGGEYGRVARYLGPVSNGLVGLLVLGYLYRVVRWKPARAAGAAGQGARA